MIENNTLTNERHVFCDRCSKELTDEVYSLITGDCLCKECFDQHYVVKPVREYIYENVTH